MYQRPFHVPGFEPSPSEYLDLSWEMFGELCRALALKVARDYDPDLVIGISRAGALPGAVIATILGIDFYSMKVSRRDDEDSDLAPLEALYAAPREATGKRVLVVDEVTTSGDTLRLALAAVRHVHAEEVRTATSFARTRGYRPDYFALETDAEVVLPWDHHVMEDDEFVANPRYEDASDDEVAD